MDKELYQENRQLRYQLKALLAQARQNEQKMLRFNEQEFRLISTNSLADLIRMVVYDYRATFELDVVTLTLIDTEKEINDILEIAGFKFDQLPELILLKEGELLDEFFGVSISPKIDSYRTDLHAMFFEKLRTLPANVVILPLIRQGNLIGSLNLGSFRSERFVSGSRTDFLERLAAIVAICVENATNHERLKLVGLTDPLTGVNNRRFFEQRLLEEVSVSIRHRQPLACMFLDVDHFKQVNDKFGHQLGDVVLQEIARLINQELRSSDIIARYGGEEFVALLPNTLVGDAGEIAERIRETIAGHNFYLPQDKNHKVSISIGLSVMDGNTEHTGVEEISKDLVANADDALYQAKKAGRNRVVFAETLKSKVVGS
jgi:diguanylate cyclase (GGDEF)-like protein